MAKSIYVGNLPWSATEEQVQSLFADYGPVVSVKLVSDRETGRARGFGFVEMEEPGASAAIEALDNANFGGRTLRVNQAPCPASSALLVWLDSSAPRCSIGALFLCPFQSGRRAGGRRARLRKRAFCGRPGRHSIRLQDICFYISIVLFAGGVL